MPIVHPFITFITTALEPVDDSKTSCEFLFWLDPSTGQTDRQTDRQMTVNMRNAL